MSLTYSDSSNSFILTTKDEKSAKDAGLTLSTRIRGAQGEKVFYTSDYNKNPAFNPYAVVPFWEQADELALSKINPLVEDYKDS